MQLPEEKVQTIIAYLQQKVSPDLIVLFGSAAKGVMHLDSDVDIAYLSNQEYSDYELFLISQGLAGILRREVDLIDLNKASTVFQAQIVGNGKVIFCRNESRRMYFEMHVLKKYAKLNEERQLIINSIKKRGTVYGD